MPTFRDKSEIPSYFNGTARLQPVYDEYLDPKMYKMLTEGNQKYYKELADTIGNLYESIIPSTIQTQNINVLINLIKLFLSKITVSPDSFNGCTISHIQPIGSFAYGTLRSVSCIADMAVVLKTLPTQESILLLAKAITADVTTKGQVECNFQLWEFGFVLKSNDVCVRIFIGTIPSNLNLLNPTMHYDLRILNKTDLFIKSSKWFEQNCTNPLLVALVTVIKHLMSRLIGLKYLDSHTINVLCYHCIYVGQGTLSLSHAFIRFFKLIGSGCLLPKNQSITDPSNNNHFLFSELTLEESDTLTNSCQFILRIILNGGEYTLLNKEVPEALLSSTIKINNFTISCLPKAYSSPNI